MSIPTRETTFGTLKYNGQTYEIFSVPIGEQQSQMIKEFKKAHNYGYSSASWIFNIYEWEIEDNKLFLTNVGSVLAPDDREYSILQEVFGTDKLLADWYNINIKALVEKIDEQYLTSNLKECSRKILRFRLENGILKSVKDEIEVYQMKVLKNYIED
jgi:hypothetical protein